MIANRFLFIGFISILLLVGCGNEKKQSEQKVEKKEFKLPTVPVVIQSEAERALYTTVHYWENFDFNDTTYISENNIIEQAFADFLYALPNIDKNSANEALSRMMQGAAKNNDMFLFFAKQCEKYLDEPNSPYRNEEMYIVVLEQIIANDKLHESEKVRPRFQLERAMKNRVGEVALPFPELNKAKGNRILIFFFNPDCSDCSRVKQYIADNRIGELATIVAVNPDEDAKLEALYSPRAVPSLYLLDEQKRVILKDATIESIHALLEQERR